jgi:hypothetical protein
MRGVTLVPELAAIVRSSVPLRYDDGVDTHADRPAHVRAASGLAPIRGGLALIQDDANFVALVTREPWRVRAINLEPGEGGGRQFDRSRGNKEHKLDLEACFTVADQEAGGTLLVAMGSGSKGYRPRETVVLVRHCESPRPQVTHVHLPRLYDRLRNERDFAGSQMNIEGAVHLGDRVRLFNRGNGEAREGLAPVNATCDLAWDAFLGHAHDPGRAPAPEPADVVRYDLGSFGDVPFGFTDAALWRGTMLYSAVAEDSPNVIEDGAVHASVIGVIADGIARCAVLTDGSGAVFGGKVEGIQPLGSDDRLLAVVDADDHAVPSLLCEVQLLGAW